jgi:ABC-type transport system substrate-binding protein
VTLNGTELYQNGTISVEPMLASSWNESASGTNWTFFLQKGVTFSNGDAFNAYQVWGQLYGFYYLSGNTSGWAVGYNVFNMNSSNFGPSTIALMSSTKTQMITPTSQMLSIMENKSWPIYVVNQNEIGFNLKASFAYFPQMWVQFTGLLFDTQYVLNNGGFGTPAAYNTAFNYAPIPGTGPYEVVNSDVVPNSAVTFTQNTNYWAKNWTAAEIQANPYMDPGHVKTIVVTVQPDDVTRYVDLSSGSAYIGPVLTADWSSVLSNSKLSPFEMPDDAANTATVSINTQRYPTNNTDFRLAIVYAINYTQLSDDAFLGTEGGGLTPMMGPEYPSFTQLYDLGHIAPYYYNVTLAEQYLKESGINTATLAPMDFRVLEGCGVCESAAQLITSDLAAINIPVTVVVTTPSQWGPPLVAGYTSYTAELNQSQQASNLAWFGAGGTFAPDEPTPADSLLTWVSNESITQNSAIYYNPTVQICVDDLTNGASQSALISACTAAQQVVAEQAPYIWLGSVKLSFGGGDVVYNNQVVKSFLMDPEFSGDSDTAIFNTVQFVNGQDQ